MDFPIGRSSRDEFLTNISYYSLYFFFFLILSRVRIFRVILPCSGALLYVTVLFAITVLYIAKGENGILNLNGLYVLPKVFKEGL